MLLDAPSCSALVRQNQEPGRQAGSPAEPLAADRRSKSHLGVVTPQRLLDRGELRLQLGHEQRLRRRVPTEQVDGTSLPVDGVRNFRVDLPADRLKSSGERFGETRVASIEQPVQLAATPPNLDGHLRVEHGKQRAQLPDRGARDSTPLDQGDLRLAAASARGDISLSQAKSSAQRPSGPSYSQLVHPASLTNVALPAITRRCPSGGAARGDAVEQFGTHLDRHRTGRQSRVEVSVRRGRRRIPPSNPTWHLRGALPLRGRPGRPRGSRASRTAAAWPRPTGAPGRTGP